MSTPESTALQKANHARHKQGMGIAQPHWTLFQLWWFPRMVLGNVAGIHNREFQGRVLPQNFGVFMQSQCMKAGVHYANEYVWQGPLLQPLRMMLQRLNVGVWTETTIGSSYWGFKGLDAYFRYFGTSVKSAPYEAWYVLNTEEPVDARILKYPEEWYTCHVWRSMGQWDVVAEDTLQFRAGIEASSVSQYLFLLNPRRAKL